MGNATILVTDLPWNTSGLMQSAPTGTSNFLRGVKIIILNICLYGYLLWNFQIMIKHGIVVVLHGPVLFELSFHFIVNFYFFRGVYVKPHCSAISMLNNFAVFNHDFAVFNGVRGVTERSSHALVLLGYVGCFRIHIVNGYIRIRATT